uniref:GlutR_dimer domain-containing protein n=1 Tax=Angiostrongylus cantonensis TaxID=6313 RepID=A0A0K0D6L1_ANGCA
LIEQRARLLRQDRIRRNLSRKLESRPGPLELVTRKILQADADLEQAIEGELDYLFTSNSFSSDEHIMRMRLIDWL